MITLRFLLQLVDCAVGGLFALSLLGIIVELLRVERFAGIHSVVLMIALEGLQKAGGFDWLICN